jgi:FkbM family methyltransferase
LRSFKAHVQTLLDRAGVYQRVKASWIYDLYWTLACKRIIDDRRSEIDFYRHVLGGFREGDLIFDVGANQGYKTGIFLTLGARVVAMEPDAECLDILQQRFVNYRLRRKPLTIVGKAISDSSSVQTMWIDEPGSAKNTLSRKWVEGLRQDDSRFGHTLGFTNCVRIETVPLEELISTHGLPYYIKIDVEGHELSVLRGLRRPVPYLSFEVNLPEFRPEGIEGVRLLACLTSDGSFNYTPDCRHGLALDRWCNAEEISEKLEACEDRTIEVFWKTPLARR